MLLNGSYFIGKLALPQLGQPAVERHLNNIINSMEPEILAYAMGYDLYSAFIAGIDVGSDEAIEQKWLDLLNGVVFTTQYSIKKKFKGIANNTTKESLIAGIIYEASLRDNFFSQTVIGTTQPQSENAVMVSPDLKMCIAWFDMWQSLKVLWEFLQANTTVYTQYSYIQINYDYFQPINQFGI